MMIKQYMFASLALFGLCPSASYATVLQTHVGIEGVVGGGGGFEILSTANDTGDWIDGFSAEDSTGTLYYSFTAEAKAFGNGENPGGSFAGLHLYGEGNERLLIGNNWGAHAWSGGGGVPDFDLNSLTPEDGQTYEFVELNAPAKIVVRIDFNANADDDITIWFNPQVGAPEFAQPPFLVTTLQGNARFDAVNLRAGNDGTEWDLTDITFATEFSDVVPVPEPGSFALLAFGAMAMIRRRR